MPDDLDRLASVLADADAERETDIAMLDEFGGDELDYLARLGELEDPATDGVENERCV